MTKVQKYATGCLDLRTPRQAHRTKQHTVSNVVRGCVEHVAPPSLPSAEYFRPVLPEHKGNPFIEALDVPRTERDIQDAFNRRPKFSKTELALPEFERISYVEGRLDDFRYCSTSVIDAIRGLTQLMVRGYACRNVLEMWGRTHAHGKGGQGRGGQCAMLHGLSGIGKTTTISVFQELMGPQAVMHHEFNGKAMERPQIKFLPVVVQPEMERGDFCRAALFEIDKILGGPYGSQYLEGKWSDSDLAIALQSAMISNSVGVLIAEECQNFYTSKNHRRTVADFVVALRELCKIPIVLVGTPLFAKVLNEDRESALASRLVEGGIHELKTPADDADDDWLDFMAEMWKYQWLREPRKLDRDMSAKFFECTRGIKRLAVALFKHAQLTALDLHVETISIEIVEEAYRERMAPIHDAVKALANGDVDTYEDLVAPACAQNVPPAAGVETPRPRRQQRRRGRKPRKRKLG